MSKQRIFGVFFVLAVVAILVVRAQTPESNEEPRQEALRQETLRPETTAVSTSVALKRVETIKVCMVNDTVFPKDQIPIKVGPKTYYGCCQNCVKTLNEQESARFATDPLSGKKVDKSDAVIAAKEDGTVLYFEDEANFTRYVKQTSE